MLNNSPSRGRCRFLCWLSRRGRGRTCRGPIATEIAVISLAEFVACVLTELVVGPKRSLVAASIKGIVEIGTVQSTVLHAKSGEVGTLSTCGRSGRRRRRGRRRLGSRAWRRARRRLGSRIGGKRDGILLDITAHIVVIGHAQIGTSETAEFVVSPIFGLGGTSCAGHTPVLTGLGVLDHPWRLQVLTNDASRCAIGNLVASIDDDGDGHWHWNGHRNGLDDDVFFIAFTLTAAGLLLTATTFRHFAVASIDADGKRCNGNHFCGLGELHGQCRGLQLSPHAILFSLTFFSRSTLAIY